MNALLVKTSRGQYYRPQLDVAEAGGSLDSSDGFCLACGQTQFGVEPDARAYICESCGKNRVYGLEELLIMGVVDIVKNWTNGLSA
jgi:hypothetical protein